LKPAKDSQSFRFLPALRPVLLFSACALLSLGAVPLAAQPVEENLAPIAKVCLAGQDCVGGKIGETAQSAPESVAAEAAAQPAAAATEPLAAVESAPDPAIEAAPADTVTLAQADADDGFDLQASYRMFCFACHSTGLSGAPLPGDAEAWAPRMEKGREEIIAIMNRGLNAMPPKGLCMTCTDDQLWELSQYMVTLEE